MNGLIDIMDFSAAELDELIELAEDIMDKPHKYAHMCDGKKIAALFFEPSTRTRLSFEAAMYELGGNVLSVSDPATSSVSKGESVADTAKVVSNYADIIVMRHPKEGSALVADANATVPVINAGDGGHCHPTQTLADLMTIHAEKGHFENLTVGLCGDLKYGRTVHSLINALTRYTGIKFVLISPAELSIPAYLQYAVLDELGMDYEVSRSLEQSLPKLDILYMTRIQRERFKDPEAYERLKDSYILTPELLTKAKSDLTIMHPMPRVNEISVAVDKDPRACYIKQAAYGKYMRMALILKLMGLDANRVPKEEPAKMEILRNVYLCKSARCITSTEQELPSDFKKHGAKYRCIYCEKSAKFNFDGTAIPGVEM